MPFHSFLRHPIAAVLRAPLPLPTLVGVLLLVVVLLGGIPAAQAAGGEIQVVSTDETVVFPGAVDLTLTARGDAEIVEIKVLFRSVGSHVWGYAYPDFEPATSITATQALPAGGSTYLPPGAEIEYYYEIRDSQGNLLRTDPVVIEYLDNSIEWERTVVGPLTLLHYDQPNARVAAVTRSVEQDLEGLLELLQISSPKSIKGVLYTRASDAGGAFPSQSQTTTELGVFQGFAFPRQNVFVGLGMDRGLIVHEAAHLLMEQALGENTASLPSWLEEGFAGYVEPGANIVSGPRLHSRSIPLRSMNTVSGTPNAIRIFYQKAQSVVAYMIEEHGEAKFQGFLGALNSGQFVNQALVSVYGFDIDELDANWAGIDISESKSEPQPATTRNDDPPPIPPPSPSPFVYFNSWIIGGLAIVVASAFVLGRIVKRLTPNRNSPDSSPDSSSRVDPWEHRSRPYEFDDN